jgi:hypothetical protein
MDSGSGFWPSRNDKDTQKKSALFARRRRGSAPRERCLDEKRRAGKGLSRVAHSNLRRAGFSLFANLALDWQSGGNPFGKSSLQTAGTKTPRP